MAHFKGYAGGWVDADEGLVTLHPSMAQGGGEVTCTLSQLLNVTHKPASRMVNGHVQLTIGGTGSGTLRTARCLYTWGQRGTFAPLVEWLERVAVANVGRGDALAADVVDTGEAVAEVSTSSAPEEVSQEPTGGWLARRREAKKLEHDKAQHDAAVVAWEQERDDRQARLELAEGGGSNEPVQGFVLKVGERAYAVIEGVALIEPRRTPGKMVGGSSGASFRVAKGVTLRTGRVKGTYVPGPEMPTPVDTGTALVTNRRVAFSGPLQTREWLFDKMIGVDHDASGTWTALQVSNRQRTSGIAYGIELSGTIHALLDIAMADWQGRLVDLVTKLRGEIADTLERDPR